MTRRCRGPLAVWLAVVLALGVACAPEPEAPPPLDLAERDARLEELRARRAELASADTSAAAGLLDHDDHRIRRAAAQRLAAIGTEARPATAALVRRLADPHPRVQTAAAIALGAIGDPAAIDPLVACLVDENRTLRLWAWKALRKYGDTAIPVLVSHMRQDSPFKAREYLDEAEQRHTIRDEIRLRLTSLGKPVVPHVIAATRGDDDWQIAESVRILGDLGKDSVEGIPALVELFDRSGVKTREQVVRALGAIGDLDPAVVPALQKAAKDHDSRVSRVAKSVLKEIDKAAAEAERKKQDQAKDKAARRREREHAKPRPQPAEDPELDPEPPLED